jgi:undecaprenyl-diphosphatase
MAVSRVRRQGVAGLVLLVLVLVLGAFAATSQVTAGDLRADKGVRSLGFPGARTVAVGLTDTAQEAVGLGALALALVVLVLTRRRWDAARLFGMAGAAWAVAFVVKTVMNRPRPPASLWLSPPDPTGSFPSGHATTVAVIVLIAVVLLRGTRLAVRVVGVGLATAYAAGVGLARLYLGDHYPTDVLAGYLIVAGAALLVAAVAGTRRVRRPAARLLRIPALDGAEDIGVDQEHDAGNIRYSRPTDSLYRS